MSSTACEPGVLRVSGLVMDSIVDGPGLRLAVFTQGCPHACPGCHNPQSHDSLGGTLTPVAEIAEKVRRNPLLSGVTLTGGEPLEQAEACLTLLKALPEGLSCWLYTGWTWEEIWTRADPTELALLRACEVMVDGRYIAAERTLSAPYRGSRNQRLIDVRKTLAGDGTIVPWEPPAW
ncbi:anaerobic ribonucleoside-triphosphate reductase activating protein [Eubacteriales bacterium OttesenSCG-928-A19]|nr:anaerobic ribonucleoside-triphosphate reductase activating protein [Eubacteriales bacterium OttesenSCG-928-A19]